MHLRAFLARLRERLHPASHAEFVAALRALPADEIISTTPAAVLDALIVRYARRRYFVRTVGDDPVGSCAAVISAIQDSHTFDLSEE